jgi:CRP-like cAMP-binding protein
MFQKYSLFGGMLDDQIENIIPLMEQEKFNQDDYIIKEGISNDKVYFIIEGKVAVIKGDVVLNYVSEGEAFGEMEVLDIMPAAASIKAISPVTVMTFSNKALRTIYNMDIKIFALIIMNLARDLSRCLRKMDEMYIEPLSRNESLRKPLPLK